MAKVLAALVFLLALDEPRQFSRLDLWEKECNAGDAPACAKLAEAQAGLEKLARLDELAQRYGAGANRDELEEDGRPLLNIAYMQVMQDFIEAEQAAGHEELAYDAEAVSHCAGHFHNFWLSNKLWWPTDENDEPSWADIYYYVVDHYHGVCLRRYFNQF
ncbi:MAG: hypothetical protein OXD47_12120 [Gammaproteobacteria bacterium]|nr:hypothetical protein [Gammaproteobacteria bacterium]MCY4339516.1 hypothetical protein [Gammaproteobacteria bacterium]